MDKDRNPLNGGLRKKLFLVCCFLVITASVAFAIIGILQLRASMRVAAETNVTQNEAIKQRSGRMLTDLTNENMLNLITLTAEKADGEFWTMQHDFTVLAEAVTDVLEHPENYGEREVSAPDAANAGRLVLQLLFADEEAAKDPETLRMVRKLANLEPVMAEIVRGSDEYTKDCYISLAAGATLAMDPFSENKIDENGRVRFYNAAARPWYTAAAEKGGFCFTLAVQSFFRETPEVEYGYPIYVDGRLAAVLQGSTRLDVIQKFISDVGVGENGFSIMVSDEGQLVYSPRNSGDLKMINGLSTDIRESGNAGLVELINEALRTENGNGLGEAEIDGEAYFAAYAPMPTIGWTLVTFVPKSELEQPVGELLAEMDTISEGAGEKYRGSFQRSSLLLLAVVILMIFNASLAAVSFSGRITKPIHVMTKRIENLTGERFVFKMDDVYKTGDEIEILANTFGMLSDQMEEYLRNILAMTAEKQRVGTELSIAAKIQADMLPNKFPAFPDRQEFDLFASMNPAKEVGGDFYDFFMVDDDHLAAVIADVSDKGVPAALFMMSAKIIINYRAQMGGTPGEILTAANAELCKNNRSKMFVTVWLGILELSTGRLTCTNAGHEYPFIRGGDGVFRVFQDKHGLVVGAVPKMVYKDYELQLKPGDAVFVYTDGVTEAANASREMYGMERLGEALNRLAGESPQGILEGVKADVDTFADGAVQSDDVTMLCLEYRGGSQAE